MNDSNSTPKRPARNGTSASGAEHKIIEQLYDQIAELQATVETLRASRDELELDHRALQEENQRLRREMTLANLIEDLDTSIEEVVEEAPHHLGSLLPGRPLYERLPSTFPFPAFFEMAEEAGVGTEEARRLLVRYLADGLLVQSGAYLKKGGADGGSSPRPAP
jgi:TolA-binding protein